MSIVICSALHITVHFGDTTFPQLHDHELEMEAENNHITEFTIVTIWKIVNFLPWIQKKMTFIDDFIITLVLHSDIVHDSWCCVCCIL